MKKKQFVVLGLGRFGMSVAKTLSENGYDVMAVDINGDHVQEASAFVTHAVKADISNELSLRALGIGNFDVVVVATASHLESGVMATLLAKELGIPTVVAKAQDSLQKKILEKIGADRVVFPEREMGVRLANSLLYGNFFEFMELSDEFGLAEFETPFSWINKTLAQSEIRAKYGLNVVALKREGKMILSPSPDEILKENDIMIAMGESRQIQRIMEKTKNDGSKIFE